MTINADLEFQARIRPLLQQPDLRLVVVSGSHPAEHVLVAAQRHRMDEDQAISVEADELRLYRHGHIGTTVLGGRDIRKLHLLP